jgi:hypothetical protein
MPSMALAQDRVGPTGERQLCLEDARLLHGAEAFPAAIQAARNGAAENNV